MNLILVMHVAAGALAMVFGFIALYSAKGAAAHRKTGRLFVYVILVMGVSGTVLALVRDKTPVVNIPAAMITCYAAFTALTTVRPGLAGSRPVNIGAMLVALAVSAVTLFLGFDAVASGGRSDGVPAAPLFIFGAVGLIGAFGDYRVLTRGVRKGSVKVARHLWRMCFALFVAALSLSVRTQIVPKPIRGYPVLTIPVIAVLLTMIYWLWRIRRKKSFRRVELRSAVEATA
jgi:hypothetical protein